MGKRKYIETPEILWEYFKDYVLHEKNNPMYKVEYVGKEARTEYKPLETPITFEGFECWLADKNIIEHLSDYSANTKGIYDDYSTIITRIKSNCYVHNFKGAAVGLFNANIIARKLGMIEKIETDNKHELKEFTVRVIDNNPDGNNHE
jgi:hypothetical protein